MMWPLRKQVSHLPQIPVVCQAWAQLIHKETSLPTVEGRAGVSTDTSKQTVASQAGNSFEEGEAGKMGLVWLHSMA